MQATLLPFAAFGLIERVPTRPTLDLSFFRFLRFVGAKPLAVVLAYAFVVLIVPLPVRFIGNATLRAKHCNGITWQRFREVRALRQTALRRRAEEPAALQ